MNAPPPSRRWLSWLILTAIIGFGLPLLSGCKPAAPTVTPVPPTATATVAPVIVFATPRPTATVTIVPTAVIDPGIQHVVGTWTLGLDYQLLGYPIYSTIHYSGTVELIVNLDGSLTGSGDIYTTLEQPPCNAIVRDGSDLPITLSGQLHSAAVDGDPPAADLLLTAVNPSASQSFELDCLDHRLTDTRTVALFWPALVATNQLHLQFPFRRGVVLSAVRNLTAPTGGTLHGTLTTQVRIG